MQVDSHFFEGDIIKTILLLLDDATTAPILCWVQRHDRAKITADDCQTSRPFRPRSLANLPSEVHAVVGIHSVVANEPENHDPNPLGSRARLVVHSVICATTSFAAIHNLSSRMMVTGRGATNE